MSKTQSPTVAAEPIAEAVDKNKAVAEEVKGVAEELAVVHTVLEKKLDDGDVAAAVARTGQAEKQLEKAAEKLEEVNKALDDELKGSKGSNAASG